MQIGSRQAAMTTTDAQSDEHTVKWEAQIVGQSDGQTVSWLANRGLDERRVSYSELPLSWRTLTASKFNATASRSIVRWKLYYN